MPFNLFAKAGFILTTAIIAISTASLQAQTPDLFLKQDPTTGSWVKVQKSPGNVVSILGPAAAPAASSVSASLFASFNPYQALPVGSWPEAVAIGDVNNDGFNDVVMTTSFYFDPQNDYKLFVFLQNPDGSLAAPQRLNAGNGDSVAIGDFNSDGLNDVVTTSVDSIGIFYQNSTGQLGAMVSFASNHSSIRNTYKVVVGDFNSDGKKDVASIDWGMQSTAVDVFLQNASGTMNTPVSYTVNHSGYDDMAAGDVTGDGRDDIVVMSGQLYATPNFGVLAQNASGTFSAPVYYNVGTNIITHGVALGDINGDSRSDVVVTHGGNVPTSRIASFTQNTAGTLSAAVSQNSFDIPESIKIADVDNDGRKDVVVLHGGSYRVGVYLQQSNGTLAAEQLFNLPYASHYNPHGLALGDINSDGRLDIVIADYNNGLLLLTNALPEFASYYGAGVAGTNSLTPRIRITSPAMLGNNSFGIELTAAPANSACGIVLGYAAANIPTFGVNILNNANIALAGCTTNAFGKASFNIPVPSAASLNGFTFKAQFVVADPAGPQGVTASNGMTVTVRNQ